MADQELGVYIHILGVLAPNGGGGGGVVKVGCAESEYVSD